MASDEQKIVSAKVDAETHRKLKVMAQQRVLRLNQLIPQILRERAEEHHAWDDLRRGELPLPRSQPSRAESEMEAKIRSVAEHQFGWLGSIGYQMWDHVNDALFDGQLPTPFILWAPTNYGACLGLTRTSSGQAPMIQLHPSLVDPGPTENPWGTPRDQLGVGFAFDTVIHEAMHVAVDTLYPGHTTVGDTSHNNEAWIAEVNRIAPLLGFDGIEAGGSKVARVKQDDGTSKVKRIHEGNVPYKPCVTNFPRGLRQHLDPDAAAEYYRAHAKRIPTLSSATLVTHSKE